MRFLPPNTLPLDFDARLRVAMHRAPRWVRAVWNWL